MKPCLQARSGLLLLLQGCRSASFSSKDSSCASISSRTAEIENGPNGEKNMYFFEKEENCPYKLQKRKKAFMLLLRCYFGQFQKGTKPMPWKRA